MSSVLDLARPELRAIQPYVPGAYEPGCIRLNANESPWRAPGDTTERLHAIAFDLGREYTETEVNALLEQWASEFGSGCGLDRVTMRRLLVDEGYLRRDPFGTKYVANSRGFRFRYDPMIRMLDLQALVEDAHAEREARKAAREQGAS